MITNDLLMPSTRSYLERKFLFHLATSLYKVKIVKLNQVDGMNVYSFFFFVCFFFSFFFLP